MNPQSGFAVRKASTGDNQLVWTGKCLLQRIIIGADVANATIEVSDSLTDGDGNMLLDLAGSTLMTSVGGALECNIFFEKGICVDQTNQTKVTYVVVPTN